MASSDQTTTSPLQERAAAPERTGPDLRAGRLRRAIPLLYALPALALYGAFVLWPLLSLGALSLTATDAYSAPIFVGLDNYRALLSDPNVVLEAQHSLLWVLVTLCLPPLAGLGLALLLAAMPGRARGLLRALLLLPLLLPATVIAVAWRLFYNPLSGPLTGLLQRVGLGALAGDWLGDPHLALTALLVPACWAALGLPLLVFGAGLASVSPALLESASIDGAGVWARLRWIMLPHVRGLVPLALVVTAFGAVPSFDLVRLLTNGGPGYATTILPLDMYGRAFGSGQLGAGAALACLQMALGLVLTAIALAAARRNYRESEDETGRAPRIASRTRAGRVGATAVGGFLTAVVLWPVLWLFVLAVVPDGGPAPLWLRIGQNVRAVWASGFGGAFLTSLAVALCVAGCTLVLAVPAAFALATTGSRSWTSRAGLAVLALGLFQPASVLIIPLFTLLQGLQLLDSPLGLILPQTARAIPLAVLLLWVALRDAPSDILAAAEVDGAPPYRVLWSVALPLVRPMIAVAGVWAFLSSWNDFTLPTVVIQDETLQTLPVALGHYIGRVDTQYALLATAALLASAPLLALYGTLYSLMRRGLQSIRNI